jgi:hypothetical protein
MNRTWFIFITALSVFSLSSSISANHCKVQKCVVLTKRLKEQIKKLSSSLRGFRHLPPSVRPYVISTITGIIEALTITVNFIDKGCNPSQFSCTTVANLVTSVDVLLHAFRNMRRDDPPISIDNTIDKFRSDSAQRPPPPPRPNPIVIFQNFLVHDTSYIYGNILALFGEAFTRKKLSSKTCKFFLKNQCPDSTATQLTKFIKPLMILGKTTKPSPGVIPPSESTSVTIRNIRELNTLHGCDLTSIVCNTLRQLNTQLTAEIVAARFNLPRRGLPAAFTLEHTLQHFTQIFDPLYVLIGLQRSIRR